MKKDGHRRRAALPTERQCAMLVAHLLAKKQEDGVKEWSRARLSEITLRRLFGRQQIPPTFLVEVQEWLFKAGWALFAAKSTYAVVKIDTVERWGRISSKRISDVLDQVSIGEFDFNSLEELLLGGGAAVETED